MSIYDEMNADLPDGRDMALKTINFVLNSDLDHAGLPNGAPLGFYRPAHAVLAQEKRYSVTLNKLQIGTVTRFSAWTREPPPKRRWSSTLYYAIHGLNKNGVLSPEFGKLVTPNISYSTEEEAQNAFNAERHIINIENFTGWPQIVFYVQVDYRNDAGMMNITLVPN